MKPGDYKRALLDHVGYEAAPLARPVFGADEFLAACGSDGLPTRNLTRKQVALWAHAFGELASAVTRDREMGSGVQRDTRFGSTSHALKVWFLAKADGTPVASPNAPEKLKRHAAHADAKGASGPPQWERQAWDVSDVSRAIARAFEIMPNTGDTMTEADATAIMLIRYIGEQSPAQCAQWLSAQWGWPFRPKLIDRVTRHGYKHVHFELLRMGLVPEEKKMGKVSELAFDLEGWDEIADALGASNATAKRYASHRGLPVHKSTFMRRVRARSSDIDQWLRDNLLR